jgi:hypothetical protein
MSNFGPDFKNEITIRAWHHRLKNLKLEDLDEALTKLTGNREFPTINEILNFVKGLNQDAEMLPEVAFELLWGKIGSVGGYGTPELPNEIGLAVERLGGWGQICTTWTSDKRTWHEKAFREVYGNITEAKAMGMLAETSKYAPESLKGEVAKQIQPGAKEALEMAMKASQKPTQKLGDFVNEMKRRRKNDESKKRSRD